MLRLWSDQPVTFERVKPAYHVSIGGQWKSGMAGGRRARTTWCQNPQYKISVEKRSMVQVVLMRNDVPNMKFRIDHAVGLCVCNSMGEGKPAREVDGRRSSSPRKNGNAGLDQTGRSGLGSPGSPNGRDREERSGHNLTASPIDHPCSRKMIVAQKQLVAESNYDSLSEGSLLLTMEAGDEYVVVPSTYQPDIIGNFTLQLISSSPVTVTEMDEAKSVVLAGKWEVKTQTAGGSHLQPSYDDNPQFQIRCKEATEVQIRLTRRQEQWAKNNKKDLVGSMMGFYVYEGTEPNTVIDLRPDVPRPPTKFLPEFLPVNEVSTKITLERAAHPYVVVPCTFDSGKEGPFLLEVMCESGFTLERLRKVVAAEEGEEAGRRGSLVEN